MEDLQVRAVCLATGGLFGLSLFANVLNDPPEVYATKMGVELLEQAIEWREYAIGESPPLIQLQHSIYASAYLRAARMSARDIDLERGTTLDLRKFRKSLDKSTNQALQRLKEKYPKMNVKMVSL